jgi:hypothetical protein
MNIFLYGEILNNIQIPKETTKLSAVLYGCETWSLTLREEHRMRVFENRVLRGIFGIKREEVRGGRKLHNEELRNLYSSSNIIRVIKSKVDDIGWTYSTHGGDEKYV